MLFQLLFCNNVIKVWSIVLHEAYTIFACMKATNKAKSGGFDTEIFVPALHTAWLLCIWAYVVYYFITDIYSTWPNMKFVWKLQAS